MKRFVLYLGLLSLTLVLSFQSAPLHQEWLRDSVGSRTVKLLSMFTGGSGFFVKAPSGQTYIMTNKHVCRAAIGGMLIAEPQNAEPFTTKIIEINKKHDLCVMVPHDINAEAEDIEVIEGLDVASSVRIGHNIAIVGHPKLHPLTISRGQYIGNGNIDILWKAGENIGHCDGDKRTVRVASWEHALWGVKNLLPEVLGPKPDGAFVRAPKYIEICIVRFWANQLHAYSRGGSSGSPVVNFYGNVVGVLFAGNRDDQFQSYMVPLKEIKDFLKDK